MSEPQSRRTGCAGDVTRFRRPQPVRLLARHRADRGVPREAGPASALPGREPADEPHAPHRRSHPDPPRHRRPALLPTQARHRKTRTEAMRCLKRRISDAIYRQLVADARRAALSNARESSEADPGGHCGATHQSSAVDLPPHIDTSDQPLPGPATTTLQPGPGVRNSANKQPLGTAS